METNVKQPRAQFRRQYTYLPAVDWNTSNIDWKAFCQRCTFHGVADFFFSVSRIQKCVWLLLMLCAASAAMYGCYSILGSYMLSPLYVSYIVREGMERTTPDVVVCPFNRFSASFLQLHNISNDVAEYAQLAYGMSTPYMFHKTSTRDLLMHPSLDAELESILLRLNLTFEEFVFEGSLKCEDIIQYCYSPAARGFYNCCNTSQMMISGIGMCFRLQGANQISSGYGFGLTIVMKLPLQLYTPSVTNLHNDGVSVKLAQPGHGANYDLTFVPLGVHALMPLRATLYDFINMPPQYECIDSANDQYSPQVCFDTCVFEKAEEKCHCSHLGIIVRRFTACKPRQLYGCLYRVTAEAVRNASGQAEVFRRCRQQCKAPCMYWDFYPTVSYAHFPAANLQNYAMENNFDLKNHIILDVFYERLEFTQIKHLPSMTSQQFIANLGGQLGLWVGGSILTVAQILVLLFHWSLARFQRFMERKKNKPSAKLKFLNSRLDARSGEGQKLSRAESNSNGLTVRFGAVENTSASTSENKRTLIMKRLGTDVDT